jgi:hypothetical protein
MKTIVHTTLLAILGFALWSTAAVASNVFFQATCGSGNTACTSISPSTKFPATLRSFPFFAPTAGRAEVSFHGAMICSNGQAAPRVVDLVTQIVATSGAIPIINGGGGLRHAIVILPSGGGTTDSFNLASTRGLIISGAGTKTVYFRITSLRFDAGTSCDLYNLTFSVVFTP